LFFNLTRDLGFFHDSSISDIDACTRASKLGSGPKEMILETFLETASIALNIDLHPPPATP